MNTTSKCASIPLFSLCVAGTTDCDDDGTTYKEDNCPAHSEHRPYWYFWIVNIMSLMRNCWGRSR